MKDGRDGMALVMVVMVIVALVVIATPFALSMRLQEESARAYGAEAEARLAARAARNLAVQWLRRTHPADERRRGDTIDWDATDPELRPDVEAVRGRTTLRFDDPRGILTEVEVEDEQGKVDLNSAPPRVIAHILGSTWLAASVDEDAEAIPVADGSVFYSDDDPRTLDGYVRIDGEFVGYRHVRRVPGEPDLLEGIERGLYFSASSPDSFRHGAGARVLDGRAWKIALHGLWARPGRHAPFRSVDDLRTIADWDFRRVAEALLLARGMTLERLRELGVSEGAIGEAGLDPELFAPDEPEEPEGEEEAPGEDEVPGEDRAAGDEDEATDEGDLVVRPREGEEEGEDELSPAERERREEEALREARRALREAGLDVDDVEAVGGERLIRRLGRALASDRLSPDEVDRMADRFSERVERRRQRGEEQTEWEETYYRDAFQQAARLREELRALGTIGVVELERIRPWVTVSSGRPGPWSAPRVIPETVVPSERTRGTVVRIPDARSYQRYGTARVTGPGGEVEYRLILGTSNPDQDGWERVRLWPRLDGVYSSGDARISCVPPAPVNLNSAPERVLRAVLRGLGPGEGGRTDEGVRPAGLGPEAVDALVGAITADPLDGWTSLQGICEDLASDGALSLRQVRFLLRNGVSPSDPTLGGRGSLPFTFASGDVYQVTTRAQVNGGAGDVLAHHGTREVVRVAPPRELEWTFDSQADLTGRVAFQDPAGAYQDGRVPDQARPLVWARRAGARSNLLASRPRLEHRGPHPAWPDTTHAEGVGHVEIRSAEVSESPARSEVERVEHWRDREEGMRLEGSGMGLSLPTIQDAHPFREEPVLAAGALQMWIRPDRGSDDFFLLDGGVAANVDRISLFHESSSGELVLRLADEALDAADSQERGGDPRAAELRAPVELEPDRWTHVAASWKGSRPHGDLALFVDGESVGRERYVARLAADVDEDALRIPIEDPGEFFFRSQPRETRNGVRPMGVIQVGEEVMEYERFEGNSFVIRPQGRGPFQDAAENLPSGRGARGTFARNHVQGTPVTVFGYQNPAAETVRPGGATLTRAWPGGGPDGAQMPTAVVPLASQPEDPAENAPAGRRLAMAPDDTRIDTSSPDLAADGFPPSGGFIEISHDETNRHELAFYRGIEGSDFVGVIRGLELKWWPGSPAAQPNSHRYSGVPTEDEDIVIRLCSMRVSDASDYRPGIDWPSGEISGDAEAWVQLPRPQGSSTTYEWVRYWRPPPADAALPETENAGLWANHLLTCGSPREVYAGAGSARPPGTTPWAWRNAEGQDPSPQNPYPEILAMATSRGYTPSALGGGEGFHIGGDHGRGVKGTPRVAHPAGAPVIPVVRVTRPDCGAGDVVTLWDGTDAQPRRVEMEVARAWPPDPTAETWDRLVAFTEFVPRPFAMGGMDPNGNVLPGAPRLAKWPTGGGVSSVPRATLGDRAVSERRGEPVEPSPFVGTIDELRLDRDTANREGGLPDVMPPVDFGIPANANAQQLQRARDRIAQFGRILGQVQRLLGQSDQGGHEDYRDGLHLVNTLLPGAVADPAGRRLGSAVPPSILGRGIAAGDRVLSASDLRQGSMSVAGQNVPDVFGSWKQFLIELGSDRRLIKIDDEVLGVGPDAGGASAQLVRGVLGTAIDDHVQESPIYVLPFPPSSLIEQGARQGFHLESGTGFPGEGYIGIDRGEGGFIREMLPYRERRGDRFIRPQDEEGRGTFRGSFGTERTDVREGDLAIAQPFRFFDRWAPGTASPDAVFLELRASRDDAVWRSIRWEHVVPTNGNQVVCLVRFDGSPRWSADPTNEPGGLYRFENPDPEDLNELGVQADVCEVRFSFPYRPGAFSRGQWKETPRLESVTLDVVEPARTLHREVLVE